MQRNKGRNDVKSRIMQSLGHPIVSVPINDDQMNSIIDGAIKKLWRWYSDFSIDSVYIVTITQAEIDAGGITLPLNIDSVYEVLPCGSTPNDPLYFASTEFQLARNTFGSGGNTFTPLSMVDYIAGAMRIDNYRIAMGLDIFLFDFDRFHRFIKPRFAFKLGDKLALRVSETVNPEDTPVEFMRAGTFFDNETLQDLALGMCKQLIGTIYGKFEGMALPGGKVISGAEMLNQGNTEVDEIMARLKDEAVYGLYCE